MIPRTDTIRTLRATSRDPEVGHRLRVGRLAGSLTLDGGLAPAQVLLVRSVRHRPPPASAHPPGPGFSAWQAEISGRVRAAARTAARPVRGRVPQGADAVIFEDRSELLACLSLALASGAAERSWWCALLRPRSPASRRSPVAAGWREEAPLVPAVFARLEEWAELETVADTVGRDECASIVEAVAAAHGVPRLATVVAGSDRLPSGRSFRARARPPTRWERAQFHPQEADGLPSRPAGGTAGENRTARRLLVTVALTLFHEPAVARSHAFAAACTDVADGIVAPPRAGEFGSSWLTRIATGPGRERPSPAAEAGLATPLAYDAPPSRHAPTATYLEEPSSAASAAGLRLDRPPPRGHAREPEVARSTTEPRRSRMPAALADGVATELGGVLYLVDFLRTLRLLDGFATQFAVRSWLRGWALVEALGRLLTEGSAQDPIWRILATLDGREPGEEPDIGLDGPGVHRLPVPWLEGFADHPVARWVDAEAEEIWCAGGFALASAPRPTNGAAPVAPGDDGALPALSDAFQSIRETTARRLPFGLRASDPLGRFLLFLTPHLRARLLRALAAPDEEAVQTLLRVPAGVHATPSHVDVVMQMACVSVPARLAGLDRDPGWVPELGRVLHFHFV